MFLVLQIQLLVVECMHQIVRSLNDSNFKAFITYYNGRDGGKAINYFSNYDCPIFLGNLNDIDLEQNFVIYPEIATLFLKKLKEQKKLFIGLQLIIT